MKRYLLDTNVLLHVVNKSSGYENIERHLASIRHGEAVISALSVWEIA